jgi:hypothetical protein
MKVKAEIRNRSPRGKTLYNFGMIFTPGPRRLGWDSPIPHSTLLIYPKNAAMA